MPVCVLLLAAITTPQVAAFSDDLSNCSIKIEEALSCDDLPNNDTLIVQDANECHRNTMHAHFPKSDFQYQYVRYECSSNNVTSDTTVLQHFYFDDECTEGSTTVAYTSTVCDYQGITITCYCGSPTPPPPPRPPPSFHGLLLILLIFLGISYLGASWACQASWSSESKYIRYSLFLVFISNGIFYISSFLLGVVTSQGTDSTGTVIELPLVGGASLTIWIKYVWSLMNVSAWLMALSMYLTQLSDPTEKWWKTAREIKIDDPKMRPALCCLSGVKYPGMFLCIGVSWQFFFCNTPVMWLVLYNITSPQITYPQMMSEVEYCLVPLTSHLILLCVCLFFGFQWMYDEFIKCMSGNKDLRRRLIDPYERQRREAAIRRAADQRLANQRAADQRAADQRAADQRAADQRAADQRAADQRAANLRVATQRATSNLQQTLLGMGFSQHDCMRAAQRHSSVEAAVAWLNQNYEFDKEIAQAAVPSAPRVSADTVVIEVIGEATPFEHDIRRGLLTPWILPPGKEYHFFLCHHQGSGGDAVTNLQGWLEGYGFRCWRDNDQNMEERDVAGMRDGIKKSDCFLLFYSGRFETILERTGEAVVDTHGTYESPFTRKYCHIEMLTCHQQGLPVVVVQDVNDSRNRSVRNREWDRMREESVHWDLSVYSDIAAREQTNDIVERNMELMSQLSIPFRRQKHEVDGALLPEIVRQARTQLEQRRREVGQSK